MKKNENNIGISKLFSFYEKWLDTFHPSDIM